MFIDSPTYSRSQSPHYRFWRWTYQNHIWSHSVPDSYQTSLCLYWQRMFWMGVLILPFLHLLYFSVVPVIYELLYKRMVRHVIKFDFGASVVIWLALLGLIFWGNTEVVLPTVIVMATAIVAIAAAALCFAWLLKKILLPAIDKLFEVLDFDWQVYMRHYNRRHDIPDYEYTIGDKFSEGMMHFLFWLQPVVIFLVLHFGGNYIVEAHPEVLGVATSWGILYVLAWVTISLVINFFINRHYDNKEKELYYQENPEERPRQKVEVHTYREPSWWTRFGHKVDRVKDDFREWRKATKEQVCPLVEFID